MADYYTIRWLDGRVSMLDQRLLPAEVVYREYADHTGVAEAIREMVIRGAPAIGAAAGFGMALAAAASRAKTSEALVRELAEAGARLEAARPTAVNLVWAIRRIMIKAAEVIDKDIPAIQEAVVNEALRIAEEDVITNRKMAEVGEKLVPDGAKIIHHCNTGALATVDYGTALGVMRAAHENGKRIHVFVDETRPRLQGARLTTWELMQLGIPHTLIVDGASGQIMRTLGIDLCLVGCDRIAANGDVANKIGTYNLAVVAKAHGVPFYSVGPTTTIDMSIQSGEEIVIEEREAEEVTRIGATRIAPDGVKVKNLAFDVTPAAYLTGIITECGVAYPPFTDSLARIMGG